MILGIVVGLAVIQSWFGVGLLLLGTPLLLALGIEYSDVLWTLLPCSLTVSVLQVLIDHRVSKRAVRGVFIYAVPMLLVGIAVSFLSSVRPRLGLIIAGMLTLSAILRLSPTVAARVQRVASRNEAAIVALIGLMHGMTNMGGSLLLQLATALHRDKLDIRQHTAVSYAILALAQLLVLGVSTGNGLRWETMWMAAAAGATFLVLGRRSFNALNQRLYNAALSSFMLAIAALLVWQA